MNYIATPLDEKNFLRDRRTILLDYANYKEFVEDTVETFKIVTASLANTEVLKTLTPDRPMVSSRRRAWDAIEYIHVQYSGGFPIQPLRDFFPTTIEYWEEYANYDEAYDKTAPYIVAHLGLSSEEYWFAIRLTSWAILLGHTDLLGRLCAIWDYGNQPLDGLLERLVAPYVPGRAPPPDECTRHLPYFKLLKVFAAAPEARPELITKYMNDWYHASRREPYHGGHEKGREHGFYGYWSFEAAAVSIVLDIDDSTYRDHEFYPRDMADFARQLKAPGGDAEGGGEAASKRRLNIPAGQPCPETGWWFTPAKANSRRYFKQGETMPSVGGEYGETLWQWATDQSTPKL